MKNQLVLVVLSAIFSGVLVFSGNLLAEEKSMWCVKPEFETNLSITYDQFQKLENVAPKFSKVKGNPKSQEIDFSGVKKISKYPVQFKKFQKPLYFLFESTQNASVVYVNEEQRCVQPVRALAKADEINFSDGELAFYGKLMGYEGQEEWGHVNKFKFKNLSILQQNFNGDKSTITDISSGKIFEVGNDSLESRNESRVMSYKNSDYYVSYLGRGRLKVWDIDSARLLDDIQLFEKLGEPSFFYLQGSIYDSFETGSAQKPHDLFSDDNCLKMAELNKDWLQDQLNQRLTVKDDSRYDNNLRLNYEVMSYEFLMSYYLLEHKNGILFLGAKHGYLEKIQKIKTCLQKFPEITYPPNQELVEVYRFPGATGNKSFFKKIKEKFSEKK